MEKIEQIKNIIKNKRCARVDGLLLDLKSAKDILAVYRSLDNTNKDLLEKMPINKMAEFCYKKIIK